MVSNQIAILSGGKTLPDSESSENPSEIREENSSGNRRRCLGQ